MPSESTESRRNKCLLSPRPNVEACRLGTSRVCSSWSPSKKSVECRGQKYLFSDENFQRCRLGTNKSTPSGPRQRKTLNAASKKGLVFVEALGSVSAWNKQVCNSVWRPIINKSCPCRCLSVRTFIFSRAPQAGLHTALQSTYPKPRPFEGCRLTQLGQITI